MSETTTGDKPSFWDRLFGRRDRRLGSERAAVLETEQGERPATATASERTAGEAALWVASAASVERSVDRATRRLARKRRALVAAAGRFNLASVALSEFRADRTLDARRTAEEDVEIKGLTKEEVDKHNPVVEHRALTALRLFLLSAEAFFWYQVFTRSVDSDKGWLSPERIGAVILAFVFVVVGLVLSTIFSSMLRRWIESASDAGARHTKLGVIAGGVAFLISLVAIGWMVYWRYAQGDQLLQDPLPPVPMAIFFVILLVADLLLHTFLVTEAYEQHREEVARVRRDRRRDKRLRSRLERRYVTFDTAWRALLDAVNRELTTADLIAASAATIFLDHHAKNGLPASWPGQSAFGVPAWATLLNRSASPARVSSAAEPDALEKFPSHPNGHGGREDASRAAIPLAQGQWIPFAGGDAAVAGQPRDYGFRVRAVEASLDALVTYRPLPIDVPQPELAPRHVADYAAHRPDSTAAEDAPVSPDGHGTSGPGGERTHEGKNGDGATVTTPFVPDSLPTPRPVG